MKLASLFSRIDWQMLAAAGVLAGFGLLIIYSLSWPESDLLYRQIIFLLVGIGVFFGVQLFDAHFWRNFSFALYVAVVLLLFGLLLFGAATRGTRGWFYLGPIALQPAEFAKAASVLFLAVVLEKYHFDLGRLKRFMFTLLAAGLPLALILLQPDFGSAFVIACGLGLMILYTGLPKRTLAIAALAAVVLAAGGWFGFLQDFQKQRVLTFLSPESDPLGAGYNVRQAVVAVGSGGVLGRGLGLGTQSQLNFLPEQETDFIFASLAEELGFVGGLAVLAAMLWLLWRLWKAMRAGESLFSCFFILGVFTIFLSQTTINVGMNLGLLPVTGIPLPFVSYGGSSMVASFLLLGLANKLR